MRNAEGPVSGERLAKSLGVSRQVIVQDIALLRAADQFEKLDNPVILILYVLNGLTALIEMVAIIYFSICVGQQASKYRILAAIGVYIGVHLVLGIITTLGSTILVNLFRNSTGTLLFYGVTNTVSIVYQCLVAAVCMAGAVGLMKNRLNLE